MKTNSLLAEIEAIISSGIVQKEGLLLVCQLLYDCIETYDWVGYYLHHPEKKRAGFKRLYWRIDRAYKYFIWQRDLWASCIEQQKLYCR